MKKKNLSKPAPIILIVLCFYRLKNFCGSIADTVPSTTNILHVRYFAEASAINSTFAILFTAMRDKTGPGKKFIKLYQHSLKYLN